MGQCAGRCCVEREEHDGKRLRPVAAVRHGEPAPLGETRPGPGGAVDVVVVGGGMGGLACALACSQKGLTAVILERDPTLTFRRQGYNLVLFPGSFDLLAGMGVEIDKVSTDQAFTVDMSGEMILPKTMPAAGVHTTRRGLLRDALCDACKQRGVSLLLDSHVVGVKEEEALVTVELESGRTVSGRVVVGADGIHSKVRRNYVAPGVQLQQTGLVAIRGLGPDTGVLHSLVGVPQDRSSRLAIFVVSPPGSGTNISLWGGRVSFAFDLACPHETTTLDDAKKAMDVATKDWHPALRAVLLAKENDLYLEKLRDLGDYAGPRGSGRTTLLGDAARTSMLGGGANIAFRDALDLAGALGPLGSPLPSGGEVAAALREYEAKARERLPVEKVYAGRAGLPSNVGPDRDERYEETLRQHRERWEQLQRNAVGEQEVITRVDSRV